MQINPVKFSSTLTIDLGGTGSRANLYTQDGKALFPKVNPAFQKTRNPRDYGGQIYAGNPSNPSVKALFQALLTQIKVRFQNPQVGKILTPDPITQVNISSAGQVQPDKRGIAYAANIPAALHQRDLVSGVWDALKGDPFFVKYIRRPAKGKDGQVYNDALASVMALAKQLETNPILRKKYPQAMSAKGHGFEVFDVGSGIATAYVQGSNLHTSETQNAISAKNPGRSLEDGGSLRGILQYTVRELQRLSPSTRQRNPIFTALYNAAKQKGSPLAKNKTLFNTQFYRGNSQLAEQAWAERWPIQDVVLDTYLRNKFLGKRQLPLVKKVMDRFFYSLGELAQRQIMDHKSSALFIQFIDMDNAVARVKKAERHSRAARKITNPIAEEVNQRIWALLDKSGKSGLVPNFDRTGSVHLVSLMNMDGTGYLPVAMKKPAAHRWQLWT